MPIADVAELGTIVSVWAHPDDEAYLCGALMFLARSAGSRVVCVTATRGELGVTDPVRWPPERLANIREAEMAECLRRLGVTEHHWLGYPDGGCAEVDQAEAAGRIAAVLEAVRPDTVLTFAVDGQTGHPDHIAVHHWTREAVRQTGIGTLHVVANTPDWLEEHLPKFLEYGVLMGSAPEPWSGPLSVDLQLDPSTLQRKLSALAAQASQTEAMRALAGEDYYRRLVSTERFRVLVPAATEPAAT
jgi:LmbE family N-acetylglucosaminyl deacetylase